MKSWFCPLPLLPRSASTVRDRSMQWAFRNRRNFSRTSQPPGSFAVGPGSLLRRAIREHRSHPGSHAPERHPPETCRRGQSDSSPAPAICSEKRFVFLHLRPSVLDAVRSSPPVQTRQPPESLPFVLVILLTFPIPFLSSKQ